MEFRTLRMLICGSLAVGLAFVAHAEDPTQSDLADYRAPSLRGTLELTLGDRPRIPGRVLGRRRAGTDGQCDREHDSPEHPGQSIGPAAGPR